MKIPRVDLTKGLKGIEKADFVEKNKQENIVSICTNV